MTNNFPPQGIQALILNKKRDRSMEALSKACGGNPSRANLQRLVSEPVKGFPRDVDIVRGLARGLGVRALDVVVAFSISLGLPIGLDDDSSLTLEGAGRLPDASKDLLRSMADQMLWWQEQVDTQDDAAGTAPEGAHNNVHQLPAPVWDRAAADKGESGIEHDQLPDD
ncbi:MAG TPA: hypothetical protein DCY59_11340 [Micrococcaceae bacterium]|nr:hypothetical protein [Micrococcaceae bacterium]